MSKPFENVEGGAFLLNDGKFIPRIGLGISRNTGQESLDTTIEAALREGYRLFDTAHIYGNELELGSALKKYLPVFGLSREDVFITTKVPTINENTAECVEKHIAESLEKLQTSYIDLVLVHYPRDRDTGVDDQHEVNKRGRKVVYQKLEEIQARGQIRSIGVSNFQVFHLQELFEYAKVKPAVNQFEYHPYLTMPILRHFCDQNHIFVQAFSSLCWGNQEILNEPKVQELATRYNVTPQTVLYAFAVSSNVGIIPKSATPSRIADNLHKVASTQLSPSELAPLFELDRNQSFCPRCYPWRCL